MAKQSAKSMENTGIIVFWNFLTLMIISGVVIAVANWWFPTNVVLGTISLTPLWAIILSSTAIALITNFALPFIHQWEEQRQKMATPAEMLSIYLGINFATVWLLSRVAEVFGLGVTSWAVVLGLAIALDIFQGAAMMLVENARNK